MFSDKGIIRAGLLKPAQEALDTSQIDYAVFDDVEPDPRHEIVAERADMIGSEKADLLIGFGGGSRIDIAKAAAVHAFAYPIGAEFHIPHGIANTLMLPHVMRFNLMGDLGKFAEISDAFDLPADGLDDLAAAEMGVDAIERLAQDLRAPNHLSEFGIAEKDVPALAEGVMKVTRLLANNPRTMTLKDAEEIYKAAL